MRGIATIGTSYDISAYSSRAARSAVARSATVRQPRTNRQFVMYVAEAVASDGALPFCPGELALEKLAPSSNRSKFAFSPITAKTCISGC